MIGLTAIYAASNVVTVTTTTGTSGIICPRCGYSEMNCTGCHEYDGYTLTNWFEIDAEPVEPHVPLLVPNWRSFRMLPLTCLPLIHWWPQARAPPVVLLLPLLGPTTRRKMPQVDIPIAALSRLNVHARAGHGQRNAIYAYKTLAAITAGLEGAASLRFVRWTGKCNRCTNGRYSHWDWRDGYTVRCRDCRGTSINSLYFLETTLPDGHKWHHPWSGRHRPGYEIADAVLGLTYDNDLRDYRTAGGQRIEWQPAGDWSPNKPAERLPLADLVPLLNEVEGWVETAPKAAGTWSWERAQRHLFTHKPPDYFSDDEYVETYGYALELGAAGATCFVCGSDDLNSCRYGASTRHLHWLLRVCNRHFDGPEKAAHPKNPEPPADLITPDIRRWLDRHQRMWPGRW